MLFTFPSRYSFTIGLYGVFSLTGWSRLIHAEFLVLRATQDTATNRILTCTGLSPSAAWLSRQVPVQILLRYCGPTTPITPKRYRFGLFRVRSPLLAESQLFSLPAGTKMFQFPAFASYCRITGLQPVGLPHSGMSGLTVVCTYPNLFAAYHALHRLIEPRYPPFALNLFSYFISDCFDEIDYLLLKAAYKQMNFTLLVKNESSNNLFDVM